MRTEDLFPLWCWIDDLEQAGRIPGIDAAQAKVRIYLVMEERGLGPDEVVAASPIQRSGFSGKSRLFPRFAR